MWATYVSWRQVDQAIKNASCRWKPKLWTANRMVSACIFFLLTFWVNCLRFKQRIFFRDENRPTASRFLTLVSLNNRELWCIVIIYIFDEVSLSSKHMDSSKLVVSSENVKNVLGVYVGAISRNRKNVRLLSMPRLTKDRQRQIFVLSLHVSLMKISFTASRLLERFWLFLKVVF